MIEVDAAHYLHGLVEDLERLVAGAGDGRALGLSIEFFMLPADDMTPLGLITSELVTNAVKYRAGRIDVEVRRRIDGLEIAVSDEGGGFADGFDPGASRGLGMRLVTALARSSSGEALRVDRSVAFGRIVVTTGFGGHGGTGTVSR